MTFLEVFAFIIMPVLVVSIGWGAVWLHIWDLKRHETQHPAE